MITLAASDEIFNTTEVNLEVITRAERQAYREAVAVIAAKAHDKLPECNGRVDAAVKIVLAGDVELLDDGTARVASQSNGTTTYHVVNGHCDCRDFEKAPHGLCKHRLSRAVAIRAKELVTAQTPLEPSDPSGEAPEVAPADIPAQFIVHLHGKTFVTYAGLLSLAHQRGLVSLNASFISVTSELALAAATATFSDGRTFSEVADSTPQNVGKQIAAAFPRMAATRAKARCLRDALNIGMCSLEELADN